MSNQNCCHPSRQRQYQVPSHGSRAICLVRLALLLSLLFRRLLGSRLLGLLFGRLDQSHVGRRSAARQKCPQHVRQQTDVREAKHGHDNGDIRRLEL